MRRAYGAIPKNILQEACGEGVQESVHGAFGTVEAWYDLRKYVAARLESFSREELRAIGDCLSKGTAWYGDDGFRSWLDDFARKGIISEIDSKIEASTSPTGPLSELLASQGLLPMFGFPTNTRLMFTTIQKTGFPWPPPHGTIDRQLEVAISQFAPGSETVKDKQVHKSVGVVDLVPGGDKLLSRSGFWPSLDKKNGKLGLCSSCFAVISREEPSGPFLASDEQVIEDCPVCKEPTLRLVDAREPASFFTDEKPKILRECLNSSLMPVDQRSTWKQLNYLPWRTLM